jgi:hypothetical protein
MKSSQVNNKAADAAAAATATAATVAAAAAAAAPVKMLKSPGWERIITFSQEPLDCGWNGAGHVRMAEGSAAAGPPLRRQVQIRQCCCDDGSEERGSMGR